jgi:general secretion pathway protein B
MSFILDALKKSESDRQRQNGPALFEVRVAPPRTRLPLWAIAVALLLVVNLGIVMWLLLRHQTHVDAPAAGTGPPTAAAQASGQPAVAGAATSVPVVATSAPAGGGAATPALAAASGSAAGGAAASTTPAAPAATPAAATPAAAAPAAAAPAAAATGQGSASGAPDSSSPEDYAPAEEPSSAGLANHVRRGTASGVPLYQDVSATPGTQIPQLRLDLHVFAARPQDRFVMINMHKLREGDALPEGVRVDSITPEGAILSYNGSKFLLPRD